MTYFFETYGCQMNTAESAAMEQVLRDRGWTRSPEGKPADLVILNTCAVRATAEQRVMGRLAQYGAWKKTRDFRLVVLGCMASRLGEALKEQAQGVDFVIPGPASSALPRILEELEGGQIYREKPSGPEECFSAVHWEEGQFRSFVPIMRGCDNFCSYCIVPYVRGREISRDPADITREIRFLAEKGVREITLLGQNVNSYRQGDLDFAGLLERTGAETAGTAIRRVRFLTSHPKDLSSRAIRAMAENPVFCRHLHLCVQHGSNSVLQAMNRRYTREGYLALVREIREAMPDISLSTDLLVGFPGETEEDLQKTLDLMEEVRFIYAYMYHYNPRAGTPAFTLPGRVPEEVKRERLARVMALQKRHTREWLESRLGRRERVLIEGISRKKADELITRTERDEMAVVPGRASALGRFADLTLSSLRGNTFYAKEFDLCPGD
ncbi:MAG: tRNA (N6-isopentenyl adenosine(37)-C2)-methylthiotransferase MiaB [Spirochaetaceae bacterium]|nr:tRNA (N6-isopentenyl adenosine(37)-C2)-methylthiotransferase MiaB [Spirochaetaceae bacterium]